MNTQEKMLLEVYSQDFMDSLLLSTVVEGRFWMYRTTCQGPKRLLEIVCRNHAWCLLLPTGLSIKNEKGNCIKITPNHIYEIIDDSSYTILLVSRMYRKETFTFSLLQTEEDNLHIGRRSDNDIQYDNALISAMHAILERHDVQWYICDMDSTNGVYVNRRRIAKTYLKVGDMIDMYGLKMIIAPTDILINMVDHLHIHLPIQPMKMTYSPILHECNKIQYIRIAPYKCMTFLQSEVEVEGPPKQHIKDEMPLMYILGPSITMGLSSVSMAVFSLYNAVLNKQDIIQVIPTILMAISMSLGTILWPILSKRYENKQKNKAAKHRIDKYHKYLYGMQKRVEEIIYQQQLQLCNSYPTIDDINKYKDTSNIWSRQLYHHTFLCCVAGIGDCKALIKFTYPKENFQLYEDKLYTKMTILVNKAYMVTSVPIVLRLKEKHGIGIVGTLKICEQFMIQLIYQITYFHAYQHVKIICIAEPKMLRSYGVPYLPHIFSNDRDVRYMIYDKKDSKRVQQHLEALKETTECETLWYVIFCFLEDIHAYAALLNSLKNDQQTTILHHAKCNTELPAYCEEVLSLNEAAFTIHVEGGETAVLRLYPKDDLATNFFKLANMYVMEEQIVRFPETLSFLDLYDCGTIQQLHILQRWEKADVVHTLEAAIGVHENNDLLMLDAHEDYHGPHGLVAGMTGSGKSEIILTYILSLAVNYSPHDVSFLIIDYKGGSMAKAFEKLPHIAGIITNLEQESIQRSLAAIQSELTRRQELFARINKQYDKNTLDIDKYRSLCLEHRELPMLSHLFIIADEFAELKDLQPEFLECLKQSARIGRSLGIHLILATQKPSGVVDDQIWSNSRFHICLRVQERSDSMDMLKREEAAMIRRTGVFYFQVGHNEEFKKGLAAWVQAPYEPKEFYEKRKNEEISIIDNTGLIVRSRDSAHKDKVSNITQLDAIVTYISELAKTQQVRAERIWKQELPERLAIRELESIYGVQEGMVGCIDDVYHQQQRPFCIPLSEIQHMVLYGHTRSGKELFLTTMLTSWICAYTANMMTIVIIDLDDTQYSKFKIASIIADVLTIDDTEKTESLFLQLLHEIAKRKAAVASEFPRMVIIIHNFERFLELYDEQISSLQFLLREGEKYKINILLTLHNVNSLPYRLSQYIQKIIMFQVHEESDYRVCFANHNGLNPVRKKGSGIFEKDEIYLFQTAFYELSDIQDIIHEKHGVHTFCIPVLPNCVSHKIYPLETRVFVGLDIHTKAKIFLDWKYHHVYMLANYTLFQPYITLLKGQLSSMQSICVLFCDTQMNEKTIEESICQSTKDDKKMVFVWQHFHEICEDISSAFLTQLMMNTAITHIFMETMNECMAFSSYEWFTNSLMESCILWMGNGIMDHQYFIKRVDNNLQNRLQKNRAYLWEEEQCKEIQLWEVEENG